jgi:carbamoyl-phosphate synthase large subunit
MKNILVTSANNQVIVSTIYSLRSAFYCKIVAVDRKEKVPIAEHLVDHYYCIKCNSSSYVKKILKVCQKHNIHAIIPHSIKDRILFMENKELFDRHNIVILSSSPKSIREADNKVFLAKKCQELGIPTPEQYVVKTSRELREAAKKLGFPQKKVIVKPCISNGSRGFRIINDNLDLKSTFYKQRAESAEITMNGLLDILGKKFTELIVSEFLPGKEYTVDCIRQNDFFFAIPRIRSQVKMGVTFSGKIVKEDKLIEYSKKLSEILDLTTVFGFQFKEDENGIPKILECNPRIQGTMIMSTLAGANVIATSLKQLWGKKVSDFEIDWDMEFIRIFGGISIGEKKLTINLDPR